MRRVFLAGLCLLALASALGGCMTTRSDGSPQVQTSAQANTENIQGAVAAPLRDLNVLRTKIPEVLLQALADPYARPTRPVTCGKLAILIAPLDEALGPDIDIPSGDEGDRSRNAALGLVAGVASDVIPLRGWVRKLTGAERHDNLVQSAIVAGAVRRGYLKGLGEARGCDPPATPSHVRAGTPPIRQRALPRYPTR